MKIIQTNADRRVPAMDLTFKTAEEAGAEVIIICEPNKNKTKGKKEWITDKNLDVVMIVRGRGQIPTQTGGGYGYSWVRIRNIYIYGTYLSPNSPDSEVEKILYEIGKEVSRQGGKRTVIVGDFNARSKRWGDKVNEARGYMLQEWMESLGLEVCNQVGVPTCIRWNGTSIVDLTLTTPDMTEKIKRWRVVDQETLSDHEMISFDVETDEVSPKQNTQSGEARWRFKGTKREAFVKALGAENTDAWKWDKVEEVTEKIRKICEGITSGSKNRTIKRPVYWWNEKVAELRKQCLKSKRKMTRLQGKQKRNTDSGEELRTAGKEYKERRKELKVEILRSKKEKWMEVLNQLEEDQWGKGYEIVVKQLKLTPPERLEEEVENEILTALFPKREDTRWEEITDTETPLFELEELEGAVNGMKKGKAPGADGLTAEIWKDVYETCPQQVLGMYNSLARNKVFPNNWKKARVVLIRKPGKQGSSPSCFRPISLLDVGGKIYERLLTDRIKLHIAQKGGLSGNQYGFTAGKSTIEAIDRVVQLIGMTKRGVRQTRKKHIVVAIDVRNAFNTIAWSAVKKELKHWDMPGYLKRIIADYFTNRQITGSYGQKIGISCGVPQGSIMGPLIWNIVYDSILRMDMGPKTTIIAYADDIVVIGTDKEMKNIEKEVNWQLARINEKLEQMGLEIAPDKSEAIVITGRTQEEPVRIRIKGEEIKIKESIKYLGVIIDAKLSFKEHLWKTVEKTGNLIGALGRLMPNIGGPGSRKRRIMGMTGLSIILYGAEVWGRAIGNKTYKQKVERTIRRLLIRISMAYRTVSTEALHVIAGMMPIECWVEERMDRYRYGTDKKEERKYQLDKWQKKWEQETGKAEWTKRLIPDVREWISRKDGEITFRLTQFITGHGAFGEFRKRIGKADSARCWDCGYERDTAEHAVFFCEKNEEKRRHVEKELGAPMTPGTIIKRMMENNTNWNKVTGYVEEIIKDREEEERRREKQQEERRTKLELGTGIGM